MEILDDNQQVLDGNNNLSVNFKEEYINTPFKIWRIFYFAAIGLGAIAAIVILIAEFARVDSYRTYEDIAILCSFAGILCLVTFIVFNFVLVFRNWKVIEKAQNLPITSAGQAVGFLFIPAFNLYWRFIGHGKLADSQQQFMHQAGINIPTKPNKGIAITYAVMMIIPYVAFIAILIIGPIQKFNQCKVSREIIRAMND